MASLSLITSSTETAQAMSFPFVNVSPQDDDTTILHSLGYLSSEQPRIPNTSTNSPERAGTGISEGEVRLLPPKTLPPFLSCGSSIGTTHIPVTLLRWTRGQETLEHLCGTNGTNR